MTPSASWASTERVQKSMRSNRPRDTRPEVAFRSALHLSGLRFRKHVRPLPGSRCEPDVVFPRLRLAVFFDGCWWHSCPDHGQVPRTHRAWWQAKFAATKARDTRNDAALRAGGWTVMRVWEHEPAEEAVRLVTAEVQRLRGLRCPTETPDRRAASLSTDLEP